VLSFATIALQGRRYEKSALLLLLTLPLAAPAQSQNPPTTLRGILLEQFHSTHDKEEWFAPAKVAVAGLTADQANWTPGKGQHSVGQLAYHLWYWNARALQRFKGEKLLDYSGNNDETFDKFDPAQWEDLQKKLDQVMTDWETAFETADDQKLAANASLIEHEATHNAYHLGQILYVRKLEGAWDPSKGVK
jgi:uncharacterized damage-inducible protein DinB